MFRPYLAAAFGVVCLLAGGSSTAACAGVGVQQTAAIQSSSRPEADPKTVPADARRRARDFWAKLPSDERAALERELDRLDARARNGETIDDDLSKLRTRYPELVRIAGLLKGVRWTTDGSTSATFVCTGMLIIGRNGRARCIGALTTGS